MTISYYSTNDNISILHLSTRASKISAAGSERFVENIALLYYQSVKYFNILTEIFNFSEIKLNSY